MKFIIYSIIAPFDFIEQNVSGRSDLFLNRPCGCHTVGELNRAYKFLTWDLKRERERERLIRINQIL